MLSLPVRTKDALYRYGIGKKFPCANIDEINGIVTNFHPNIAVSQTDLRLPVSLQYFLQQQISIPFKLFYYINSLKQTIIWLARQPIHVCVLYLIWQRISLFFIDFNIQKIAFAVPSCNILHSYLISDTTVQLVHLKMGDKRGSSYILYCSFL